MISELNAVCYGAMIGLAFHSFTHRLVLFIENICFSF